MKALIAFWKAKLDRNFWLMSREDQTMIKQTLTALRTLQKLSKTTRAEREIEAVRTAKQLKAVHQNEK